jgi:hypothetical protein
MKLKLELQHTLSFLEPMSLEMIYLDISSEYLLTNKEDTIEDLERVLGELVREKKVKLITQEKHRYWIKIYPKKSIVRKIKDYFSKI